MNFIKSAAKNLLRKPARSALTVLSVSIGTIAVILIGTISTYGTEAVSTELNSLGMNSLLLASENQTSPDITPDDISVIKSLGGVQRACGLLVATAQTTNMPEPLNVYLWGITSDAKEIIDLSLLYGRYINDYDIRSGEQVCMVDSSFAREAFGRDNIVGKSISLLCEGTYVEYDIVGVIKTGSGMLSGMMGEYIPDFVYTSDANLKQIIKTNGYHRVAVASYENQDTTALSDRIISRLEASSGKKGAYTITDLAKQKESLFNIMNIITLVLYCVGAVSLIVASIGIMTVMLVSVNERTREIGIKKSIGATRSIIIKEFLTESILISLIGCVTGIAFSAIILFIAGTVLDIRLNISLEIIAISCVLSVFTGVVFGVYPAVRAAGLRPVDALRTE
ncbi:MAG: ABC transporter permease [Clostridiales bacterium]|nr:ABC transporter permease [Clostridiales bacterium]